jgi:hypothetical protein
MRFAITADHRDFFTKNQYIEFEGILPLDQVALLKKNAEQTLAGRLKIAPDKKSAPEIYQAGYDLWRDNVEIKKITHKQAFAMLVSELTQTFSLRFGFDQYFATYRCTAASPYDVPMSLQEISCISPLAGALLLPLQDLASVPSFFPIPLKAGHGLFITAGFALPWPQLFATCGLAFLLIAYSAEKATFRSDSHDPHAASLKKLGYVFNDSLKDSVHPLVLRKS